MKTLQVVVQMSLLLLSHAVYADYLDYITTPNNSQIEVWVVTVDFSEDDIYSLNYSATNTYPNATFLSTATKHYNCHAWAWPRSSSYELHALTVMWELNLDYYWLDGTYEYKFSSYNGDFTTSQKDAMLGYKGRKLYYSNADHSALWVTGTWDPAEAESKWGYGPRMRLPEAFHFGTFFGQLLVNLCLMVVVISQGRVDFSQCQIRILPHDFFC
jgi:hypothetical protein